MVNVLKKIRWKNLSQQVLWFLSHRLWIYAQTHTRTHAEWTGVCVCVHMCVDVRRRQMDFVFVDTSGCVLVCLCMCAGVYVWWLIVHLWLCVHAMCVSLWKQSKWRWFLPLFRDTTKNLTTKWMQSHTQTHHHLHLHSPPSLLHLYYSLCFLSFLQSYI